MMLQSLRGFTKIAPRETSRYLSVRVRQHCNPLEERFQKPIEIPSWENLFADTSLPVHLDIGCARGGYLFESAENTSGVNFLGIEIRELLVHEANERRDARNLRNLHFLFGNMNAQMNRILNSLPCPIQGVSILHPDPWFKKKHRKRRLVNQRFLNDLAVHLPDKCPVYIQTDVLGLYEDILETFRGNDAYKQVEKETVSSYLIGQTDREQAVRARGLPIYSAQFVLQK